MDESKCLQCQVSINQKLKDQSLQNGTVISTNQVKESVTKFLWSEEY